VRRFELLSHRLVLSLIANVCEQRLKQMLALEDGSAENMSIAQATLRPA
jgi:hypothetical protein